MHERVEVSYEVIQANWMLGMEREEDAIERCVFPTWASALTFTGEIAEMAGGPGMYSYRLIAVRDLDSIAISRLERAKNDELKEEAQQLKAMLKWAREFVAPPIFGYNDAAEQKDVMREFDENCAECARLLSEDEHA